MEVLPLLAFMGAKFEALDGSLFSLTGFGDVASQIIGISGADAERLEEESVKARDVQRDNQAKVLEPVLGKIWDMAVQIDKVMAEDGVRLRASVYSAVEEAKVRGASARGSSARSRSRERRRD